MPDEPARAHLNDDVRARWDENAEFWDESMGADGNDWHLQIVRPAVERLLGDVSGQWVLEVACGNGLFARRLAALGARVLATDVSAGMVELARRHPSEGIEYRRVDAADPAQLAALGDAGAFDAIVCNMALMDMADIAPLANATPGLLAPGGRLVFSTTHPCFNRSGIRFVHEYDDGEGEPIERRGVLITQYGSSTVTEGVAIIGQPSKQLYFDRPLNALLRPFFDAGLALDGLEEPAFPGDDLSRLRWDALPEIPPVLVCRLRPA
jgi:SAM-dependent methyltransferase